jgi:hypothetical protein
MLDTWPTRVREILDTNANAYGEVVPRGGTPARARTLLSKLSADQLFDRPVTSRPDADLTLAGLWLWLDGLDECHRIVQAGQSGTPAFWHAIMHRREGDFWNSKYWYARCRSHRVLGELGAAAKHLLGPDASALKHVLSGDRWDADGFVDLVERIHADPADQLLRDAAVRLQKLEWERLFDHCLRMATAAQ